MTQDIANVIVDTTKSDIFIVEGPMGATQQEIDEVEEYLAFDSELGMWIVAGTFPYLNILILNQPQPVNHKWSRWEN